MNAPLNLSPVVLTTRTVIINDTDMGICYPVTVPGRTEEDAWQFLLTAGGGGVTGAGVQNMYLGGALPSIRKGYYAALQKAEETIAQRRATLGNKLSNPAELKAFTQWASQQRTNIARLWRIPAGPGGLLGGEIRDWRQYGVGGRTIDNLVARAESKGLSGEAALLKVLNSVDKPNPAVTEAILKGARHLRGAGAVLFVGGAALTAYNVVSAPADQRTTVAWREGVSLAGGIVGSNLAVGICFLLGVSGVGLLVVGVVAGVAGAMATERVYYARQNSDAVRKLQSDGVVSVREFETLPLR